MHGAWWSGCWKSETLRVAVTGLLHKMCTFFMAPKMPTGRDEARKRKKTPRGFSFCRLLYKNFTIAHTHLLASVAVHALGISKSPPCKGWLLVLAAQKREHLCLFLCGLYVRLHVWERERERGRETSVLCCVRHRPVNGWVRVGKPSHLLSGV